MSSTNRQILLGKTGDGTPIYLDVDKLLTTRLLIGANSGGGKSWTVRRICEQLCSMMPVMIFDWEGEFVSLREKFPFVWVGKGGEVPADLRTAKLLMHKLLELQASVIFDLSELSLPDRHQYVKLLSEAAIESPKSLWRETAFVFDEVHEVCPENGKGSSVAKQAVLGFPTKGRKRHFMTIFSTQRMHKLAMDARAEMLNRMLGQTFEPDDLDVAAKTLGIDREARKDFNKSMRTMEAGMFYSFGRAISTEVSLIKIGGIQTSNEVLHDASGGYKAPPAPDKIKKLLPKLADLPQEAAKQLVTEGELRAEVQRLKAELAKRPEQKTEVKTIEVPVFSVTNLKLLDQVLAMVQKMQDTLAEKYNAPVQELLVSVRQQLNKPAQPVVPPRPISVKPQIAKRSTPSIHPLIQDQHLKDMQEEFEREMKERTGGATFTPNNTQQRILDAIAWYESTGVKNPTLLQVGAVALVAMGGHYNNMLGPLSSNDLISRDSGCLSLTELGRSFAKVPETLNTLNDYHEVIRERVKKTRSAGGKTLEMLDFVIGALGEPVTLEAMAEAIGMAYPSGHFNNMVGPLGTLGLVTRKDGILRPTEMLFPPGL